MTTSCWPTPAQTLLLRAALFEGLPARGAFDRWRAHLTGNLDRGSSRLLPLLHHNVRMHRLSADELPLLAEAYQQSAGENASLIKAVSTVLTSLADRGIEAILLKGMPLALAYYPTPACRPMDDCDLLVRKARAIEARDVLTASGWRLSGRLDDETIRAAHAVRFTGTGGHYVDLHWYVQPETCDERSTEEHWCAAEPLNVDGAPALMLCPADMLLHVCVHGLRWSVFPSIRWVADAMVVLRTAGRRLDWDRLVDRAARQRVVLPLRESLRFLADAMQEAIPTEVIDRLAAVRVSAVERLEYRVKLAPRTTAWLALYHWLQHRRMESGTLFSDLVRFPRYLQRLRALRPR